MQADAAALLARPAFQWLFTALACLLTGMLAYLLVGSESAPAVFWPPAGLALGAAMLWGMRLVVPAGLGTALAVLLMGGGGAPALLLTLAIITQAVLAGTLLRRAGVGTYLSEVSDLFRLVLYGGLITGCVTLPLGYLALADMDGFWDLSLHMQLMSLLFSHLNGVMIFTTLLLCLLNLACPQRVSWRLESMLGLVSALLVSMLVIQPEIFGLPPSSIRPYPMLPFLLWLALRTDVRYVAVAMAWIFGAMSTHAVGEQGGVSVILDGEWIRPLHGATFVIGLSFLALAVLMGANRRLVAVSLAEALAQKDALIREVHHRIKNNLQIVAGLLRRDAAKHPDVKPYLETAITQVQSIAVVHGLHGRVTQQGVMLCELLPAISRSISELSGMPVSLEGIEEGRGNMRVQETESVALALILNELLSNAVKHMRPTPDTPGPKVTLLGENGSGRISISNPGQLPPGFDYSRGVGLGTGLGLVKALTPSPGVMIDIQQKGNQVLTEMRLGPPLLTIGERGA